MRFLHNMYACAVVKSFPLQSLLRLHPELQSTLIVVLDGDPPFEQVCALSSAAQTQGIALGMTKLDMEMFPSAQILPRSLAQESSARAALMDCAGAFSPRVEDHSTDSTFTCVIDIAGTETLFGSPDSLGEALLKQIHALGMKASIAISTNVYAAICLARGQSTSKRTALRVVPRGTECAALASLPLSVLDLSPEQADTFVMWGITTLGELADLKETELITRLGQPGKALRLLARGEAPHLFTAIETGLVLEEQTELDSPVELLESLLFIVSMMLDQLLLRAQASIVALASLTLHLDLEGGGTHIRTVRPALPNQDQKLWLKLIHLDLQAHPPMAAILGLRLSAQPGATSKVQLGLFSPQVPEPMRLDVTLARIRGIVGEGCVGRAVLKDTHRSDAFQLEPFTVPLTVNSSATRQTTAGTQRVAMRQLRPPEVVTVTLRDRQPDSFVFRETRYHVERAYGPWSSAGDWWRPTLWSHEQWDLVARTDETNNATSTLCCCLIRDLVHGHWQVEALYD